MIITSFCEKFSHAVFSFVFRIVEYFNGRFESYKCVLNKLFKNYSRIVLFANDQKRGRENVKNFENE